MSKEIQKVEPSILQIVADAAANPNIDADKMSAILTLQERIMEHEREAALNSAFAKLTPKLERFKKTKAGAALKSGGVKFFYTPIEEIDRTLRPLLQDCGLSLSYTTREIGGKAWFAARATEITKGGFRESMMPYSPDSDNSQLNAIQKVTSGLSYCERYTVAMLFNLVFENIDDDGLGTSVISEQQAKNIEDLIADSGADKGRFLKHFGISSVAELQCAHYAEADSMLNQKKRSKKNETPAS